MANYFRSVGYTSENVHSGMIVYLCNLWNEENREPLKSFFNSMGIKLKDRKLRSKREWKGKNLGRNRIDLVVSYEDEEEPFVAIEMKVDSHEKAVGEEAQSVVYHKSLKEDARLLFVTLGVGEVFHSPYCQAENFDWINLERFHRAVDSISGKDRLISDWLEVLSEELELRRACKDGQNEKMSELRGRTWSLYTLANLRDAINSKLGDSRHLIDPHIYFHGPAPDTILYFGRSKLPAYLEINGNSTLNLKVILEDLDTNSDKQDRIATYVEHYRGLLGTLETNRLRGRTLTPRRTLTLMSFDIGLDQMQADGINQLVCRDPAASAEKAIQILKPCYENDPPSTVAYEATIHPPYFATE